MLPIVAAKREEVVKSDYQFSDLIKLLPTPGHTIDHYSVQIGRPGAGAVITSDMIHSPLQARYPDLGMRVDYSSEQAGESRRRLFGCLCDTSTLVCTAHFPSPSSGYIKRSAHLLPQQGARQPWRVNQSYLRDYRALRMSQVDDGVMEFSDPRVRSDAVPATT